MIITRSSGERTALRHNNNEKIFRLWTAVAVLIISLAFLAAASCRFDGSSSIFMPMASRHICVFKVNMSEIFTQNEWT